MTALRKDTQKDSRWLFEEDHARMTADARLRALYEEEAARKGRWLQLVEARQAAALTQGV